MAEGMGGRTRLPRGHVVCGTRVLVRTCLERRSLVVLPGGRPTQAASVRGRGDAGGPLQSAHAGRPPVAPWLRSAAEDPSVGGYPGGLREWMGGGVGHAPHDRRSRLVLVVAGVLPGRHDRRERAAVSVRQSCRRTSWSNDAEGPL